MKNVRLFAVAASLGMFASTVVAAEPKTTVKWSEVPSVIKVDVDQKVIATTPTATVTSEEEKVVTGGVYALNPALNAAQGWVITDAAYWSNTADALKTLSLGGTRFLAPGSDEIEEEVYVDQLNNAVYNGPEAVFEALENYGYISIEKDEEGYIARVTLDEYTNPSTKVTTYIVLQSKASGKKSDSDIIDAVVAYYVDGTDLTTGDAGRYTVNEYTLNPASAGANYGVDVLDGEGNYLGSLSAQIGNMLSKGLIITVDYSAKKGYTLSGANLAASIKTGESKTTFAATGSALDVADLSRSSLYYVNADETGNYQAKGFKGNSVKFYTEVSGVTPIDSKYARATSGTLDAIYLQSFDSVTGRTTYTAYDYTDTAIYWVSDGTTDVTYRADGTKKKYTLGTKVKVTELNANDIFTVAKVTAGEYWIGDISFGKATTKFKAEVDPATDEAAYTAGFAANSNYVTPAASQNGWFGAVANNGAYTSVGYDQGGAIHAFIESSAAVVKAAGAGYYTIGDTYFYNYSSCGVKAATETDNASYNALTRLATPGSITIVDISDADTTNYVGTKSHYTGATRVATYTPKTIADKTALYNYAVVLGDDTAFVTNRDLAASKTANATALTATAHINGLYEVKNVPENDTDYYVLLTKDTNSTTGTTYDITGAWNYSASKEVGTLDLADGKELDCVAVQLEKNGVYYPAFNTLEELQAAVLGVSGVGTALEGTYKDVTSTTFKTWYDAAYTAINVNYESVISATDNTVDLIQDLELPTKAELTETKVVDSTSTDVKVTSNLDTIDTSVAGIKTLTYTATYNNEVVGTKDVTIVVAPKYLREYKNGKVAKLTSFYVSNSSQRYAEYVYDWTKMEATVTYYSLDDVAVSSETIKLK